ncbi:membrane cofactor protein-like isoform X2 [Mixophyes fleayi]|uniref:membrane cofactor protein-like isoform X2 n=1 Tax=Mixophyes fleayi TaxID=3061075 RepID=UPI003F4DEB1E
MFPLTNPMRNHWILLLVCLFAFFAASHGNCTAPPNLLFGELGEQFIGKNDFIVNSIVNYTCRPGFTRDPAISNTITCLSDSTWSIPDEFCKRRSCGNPAEPDNGQMHGDNFLFGSRVTYTCNTGYNMESKRDYRECQADGTWSNEVPFCAIQVCPPPNAITDGSFNPDKTDYTYQDAVTYTCKSGLSLIGEASIFCTSNGSWSADPPKCKVVSCSNPEVLNAEKLSGFSGPYTLNSAVSFRCLDGFTMIGSGHVTCNASSMWYPSLPSCNRSTVTQKPSTTKEKETEGSTVTQKPSTTKEKETGGGSGNNVGAIVGGVIAGIVALSAIVGVTLWCKAKRGGGGDLSQLGNHSNGSKPSSHQTPMEQIDVTQIQAQETV